MLQPHACSACGDRCPLLRGRHNAAAAEAIHHRGQGQVQLLAGDQLLQHRLQLLAGDCRSAQLRKRLHEGRQILAGGALIECLLLHDSRAAQILDHAASFLREGNMVSAQTGDCKAAAEEAAGAADGKGHGAREEIGEHEEGSEAARRSRQRELYRS